MNSIQLHFNRAANSYDDHCQLQESVGTRLIHLCQSLPLQSTHILDLGCGTGKMTEHLANAYPYQQFHATDISTALLTKAQQRLTKYNIKIYGQDFDQLNQTIGQFDLIFSNMALHWSKNLPATLHSISSLLRKSGTLLFSLPLTGSLHELQPHYAINTFPDFSDIALTLEKCGYLVSIQQQETIIQSFDSTLAALTSIKKIGATHVSQRPAGGLRTSSWTKRNPIKQLTYIIGYFIARSGL